MPRRSRNDRTITRSFRISERALKALEDEANRQNLSVSTILNQQLLAYAEFERFIRRLGLIKISATTFERLLRAGTEKEIARAGTEAGADTPRSMILAMHGAMNLDTALEFLGLMSEYAGQYEFGEADTDGKRIITLIHRLGPNGSVFYANYMRALFEGVGLSPKISSTEHSVTIEVVTQREQAATF